MYAENLGEPNTDVWYAHLSQWDVAGSGVTDLLLGTEKGQLSISMQIGPFHTKAEAMNAPELLKQHVERINAGLIRDGVHTH